jgi:pyridinium-3,5-bisthiocarboxylic acid mononucleotide nickel chelatase
MKSAYLDAFSGLSGDMIVGALLDAGAEFAELERAVGRLGLRGYHLSTRQKTASGIVALKFEVEVSESQEERHLGEIRSMIQRAGLSPTVTANAIAIFTALGEAEAKVHRSTPEEVHFHEVGAVDSIIDIVGAAWALDQLGVQHLLVSTLPMGTGFARSRHGIIPVPAPATMELLSGFPVRLNDGASEMVTPTGAAIVKTLGRVAAAGMVFEVERVGYGAGTKDFSDRPNVLRLMLGREVTKLNGDEVVEIAANIDDLNPQIYDHLSGMLFAAGARDVTLTPTIMKKGRPGIILSVLADPSNRDRIAELIFRETTTIGVRFHPLARLKLERKIVEVQTRYGAIRIKLSGEGASPATISPEYEDCRQAAAAHNVPLKTVIEEASDAARRTLS